MRETRFLIGLERETAGWNEPGSIRQLRAQQVIDTAMVRRVGGLHPGRVERVQGLAGCISVRLHGPELAPSAVLTLKSDQKLALLGNRGIRGTTPFEAHNQEHLVLGGPAGASSR